QEGVMAPAMVKLMERQVTHLVRLVDDLLEMARITEGTFALRTELVDIQSILTQALEASRPLVEANRHELEVIAPPDAIWVEGDAVRLSQIISNVVNNAAKYTDPGGHITVRASASDSTCEVTVSDTGIGISQQALSRLFVMFSRGDQATGRGPGGL